MNKPTLGGCVVVVLLAGCHADPSVSVEPNELGIKDITVETATVNGDRLLSVRGLDADGTEIAKATVLSGRVLFKSEAAPEGIVIPHGLELTLAVRAQTWQEVAPTQVPYQVNEPQAAELVAFERIRAVADAIQDEAGITFRRKLPVAAEVPLSYADCNGVAGIFRTDKGHLDSCCIDFSGSQLYNSYIRLQSSSNIGIRGLGSACTNQDRTPCMGSTSTCYYGACGGAQPNAYNGSGGVIFAPSFTDWCGFDTERSGGGTYAPEEFNGTQSEYGGVDPECNCTACINGVPALTESGGACTYYN